MKKLYLLLILITALVTAQEKSLSFTPNNYVRIPANVKFQNLSSFTLEFWVYMNSIQDEQIIGTEYQPSGWWYNPGGGLITGSTTNVWGPSTLWSQAIHPSGAWFHIAMVYDAGLSQNQFKIFYNGTKFYEETKVIGLIGENRDVCINRHTWTGGGSSSRLTGKIDEVRISKVARYSSNFTPPTTAFTTDANTLALYHFNEGSGSSITDASGNGITGNIVGSMTWSTDTPMQNEPPTLQTGLVAHYPFNGNANDESGNGNHATAFNTQNTLDRFGVSDAAFKFNGISGVNGSTVVSNNTLFNIGQSQYTIHFWFKPDNMFQTTRTLINTHPHTGVAIGLSPESAPGYVVFAIGSASGSWTALDQHGPKNDYQTGVWYSVTLTKSGTQYNHYINGQLEKNIDIPAAANFNCNVTLRMSGIFTSKISGIEDNLWQTFTGDMDDIRIYNRALSSAEVTELYNLETQTVSVTSPNGGETWQVGSQHNITWTSVNVTNVKLEYTTNNGSAWNSIVTSTPAAAGTYSWTVPNTPSTQCKVRVSDASNSLTSDVSNATFTIQVPAGPGWVPISNPQYNMSIIANLYFGNQLTTNGSDILGAFVGNECRGIASPNGTGLIFLSAGSNVQTGDTLTFRAWKSSTQEVRLLPDRIVFQNLGEVGTLINPYRFEDGPGWVPAANQQYNMSIIGQLYFDNILSTNTGDVVGAFVGEECRGVASPGTNGTLFLIVSSNIQTGDTVRFRGWRSSTMATEPISQTLIFQNMAEIGTLINPFRLDAGMRTLAYSFGSGYNWMSVNVNPGSMGVNSLFIPPKITPAPNDRITGQTSFCVWDGTQWLGSLSTIDPKLSYVMKLTTAQVCSLEGLPVTLSPINFGAGYTWGGFYPQSAMPINTALANITPAPTPNDRVISQSAFAVWDGSQWLGSLTTLTPGKGYKFKFTNACVLTYPAGVKTEEIKEPEKVVSAPNWVPLPNLQYNMSIIAKVQIENGPPPVYSTNANDILGAFVVVGVDTQCRGTANPIGSGLYFLTVGSNVQSGENVIFKYFNQQNDLIKAIPDVITFQNMGEIGTLVAPQIFNGGPVPVELTSFTGTVNKNKITLTWTTATEKNNKGFEVERKTDKGAFSKISFVEGYGTTTENRSYTFMDKSPASGTNIYRLRQVDYDGSFSYSNEIEVMLELPKEYSLSQNYPNPFNPSTVINYQLPANTYVTLKVFDVIGNEVATLVNQEKPAGYHSITFEAGKLSSGIYIYQLTAGEMTFTKKLILTK